MKSVVQVLGVLVLALGVEACSSDSPTSPTAASTVRFTATLLTGNEVPPIGNSEAGGSASATITFDLTKDSAGNTTAVSMEVAATVTGFPNGTALTRAHIHAGGAGTNGGIVVNLGLADGEISFPSGGGSFTKKAISVTVDQANAIFANPAGFYLNIHTARNPDGVARGQLAPAQ